MDTLPIILFSFGAYAILLLSIPKGNLFHELINIPAYLLKVARTPVNDMIVERYFFGPGKQQYLLLCRPKDGSCNRKQHILYHHGGGWGSGTPEMFKMNAQYFVKQGYWVLLPSYRKIPFNSYPQIREDLTLGLKKGLEVLKEKEQGHQQLILGGMSAGGNLVALMLYDRVALKSIGCSPDRFAGMMLFGAPLDLNEMYPSPPLRLYAGKRGSAQFKKANPITYLQGDERTPVLCFQGKKDGMVPYKAAENMILKLDSDIVTYHFLPEASHLDVGRWNFGDEFLGSRIEDWLSKIEDSGEEKS